MVYVRFFPRKWVFVLGLRWNCDRQIWKWKKLIIKKKVTALDCFKCRKMFCHSTSLCCIWHFKSTKKFMIWKCLFYVILLLFCLFSIRLPLVICIFGIFTLFDVVTALLCHRFLQINNFCSFGSLIVSMHCKHPMHRMQFNWHH